MTPEQIARFKRIVCEAARHPDFVHHTWYVDYHLLIVERLALELCARYPDADRALVQVLVWLHDYGKLLDRTTEHATIIREGRNTLRACGFEEDLVRRALRAYARFERHDTIATAPIEVRIVSSADGAAHLVGPFYAIWWHEHPARTIPELLADNRRKALTDWEKKIVLPEVRVAFAARHRALLEACGDFPAQFLAPP